MYGRRAKKGDRVICIDDASQDEDFGFSGIVLKGIKGLTVGKEYPLLAVSYRETPSNKDKVWTNSEFKRIRWSRGRGLILKDDGEYEFVSLEYFKPIDA